jgi:hypothetical protein
MNTQDTLLGALATQEPEVAERLVTRREAIAKGASVSSTVAAGLALGTVPIALAALAKDAFAQGTPGTVQAVIDFALMLEILENEFYKAVLGTSSSSAQNAAFAPVRASVPAEVIPALQLIQKHEAEHVQFLLANGAVNSLNLNANSFDFTGGRGSGTGPFARATSELAFLLLVTQAVEDTGVRAYKGQAPNLMSNSVVLEAALRIHSVEARHASKIRRLRRSTSTSQTVLRYSGTVSGSGAAAAGAANVASPPAGAVSALELIYASEGNTTHAGVDVTTLSYSAVSGFPTGSALTAAAQEAFDEPLTKAQVVSIVQPFFIQSLT